MLFEDFVFLIVIRLGEGLVDVYRTGRSGRPFADKEILYREGEHEPVVPGSKACSFWHGGMGGRAGVWMIDWRWVI